MNDDLLDEGSYAESTTFSKGQVISIRNLTEDINKLISNIRVARITLLTLVGFGVLLLCIGVYAYWNNFEDFWYSDYFLSGLIAILIYLPLGLMALKKPKIVLSIGLLFYIVINIIGFIFNENIMSGIFIKVTFLYFLFRGIQSSVQLPAKLKELAQLGAPHDWRILAANYKPLPKAETLNQEN